MFPSGETKSGDEGRAPCGSPAPYTAVTSALHEYVGYWAAASVDDVRNAKAVCMTLLALLVFVMMPVVFEHATPQEQQQYEQKQLKGHSDGTEGFEWPHFVPDGWGAKQCPPRWDPDSAMRYTFGYDNSLDTQVNTMFGQMMPHVGTDGDLLGAGTFSKALASPEGARLHEALAARGMGLTDQQAEQAQSLFESSDVQQHGGGIYIYWESNRTNRFPATDVFNLPWHGHPNSSAVPDGLLEEVNLYDVLGVSPDATEADIMHAGLHPDGGDGGGGGHRERWQELTDAKKGSVVSVFAHGAQELPAAM
eukprot:gene17176-5752_t